MFTGVFWEFFFTAIKYFSDLCFSYYDLTKKFDNSLVRFF